MFVGHEFAAFALGVVLARRLGTSDATALAIGFVAGASAILPDLDLLVAAVAYADRLGGPAIASWDGLWSASTAIHRGLSHTLVGGVGVATVLTAVVHARRTARAGSKTGSLGAIGIGLAATVGLVSVARVAGGASEMLSIGLVLVGATVLGLVVAGRTSLGARAILGGALVGLLSHPFGDVFMATPPAVFYPFEVTLLSDSVRLAADPTMNLVGIAFVELVTVWAGVAAFASATGVSLRRAVDPLAALGLGYPLLMVFVPRPTMVDAHWLGFTLAPFGIVGTLTLLGRHHRRRDRLLRALVTGLATVTLAAGSYSFAYLLFFRP
ncbi:MAG: metal-dependent hydrolase [Halobacteriota archaeon]